MLTIQNCADTDYDSLIQVFSNDTGTCPSCPITTNTLSKMCNDDHCGVGGGGSAMAMPVGAGNCYTIRVGGDAAQGASTLDVGVVCNPLCAVQPPIAPPAPHNRPKNRYISFDPNGP